jgi:Concanavalin A-like lectin/glucanases superfamily
VTREALPLPDQTRREFLAAAGALASTSISQFDQPGACGFGLFVNEDGSLSFYLGDGGAFVESNLHTTPPKQLAMEINPQGLKHFPDNTPSSVRSNRWHHVIARFDGTSKQIWVDGREVAAWRYAGPMRPGAAALRVGASGHEGVTAALLDADLAMPALYGNALSDAEIAARFAAVALSHPTGPELLAYWPLNEERGERVADASSHGRHATIINNGTWMIGGPGFDANVPRFGNYDPATDSRRGHGLRLASDDLFDCRWKATHEYRLPENARSGIYAARMRFRLGGEERSYHNVFIIRKPAARAKAPIAFLCSTNTWRAYAATPFGPTWRGIKKSIGNHSHAGRRGRMSRECGFPAWRLFGLEYFSLVGVGVPGVGPYKVCNSDHFLFRRPNDLKLSAGDTLAGTPGHALPQPIGHEGDARVSTIARFLVEPPPEGGAPPTEDPAGITLLAKRYVDAKKIAVAWDYFQRPAPLAKNPPLSVAAEMIYWERPGGGRVFHAGSINAGSTLAADPIWSGLLQNVLNHFGVERA